ncbi:MAG: FG-GAP repeat protein, partial [Candidatus Kariarchaeaceae archaeon]
MKSQSKFDTGKYFRIITLLCILLLANFSVLFGNVSSNHDTFQTSDEVNNLLSTPESLRSADNDPPRISQPADHETSSNARASRDRAMSIDLWYGSDLVIFGNASGDMEYGSMAKGDVNGDNIEDIIIGTSTAGIGLNRSMGGEVYVVFGRQNIADDDYINLNGTNDTFPAAHHDIEIYGGDKDDYAGSAVAAADVNGDNLDDIIIGVRGGDGFNNTRPSCGEIHIIWGKFNFPKIYDLNTTNASFIHADHIIYGVDEYDSLGERIATGYVNNDIYEDLCLGTDMAYSKNNTKPLAGETYVVYGDTTPNLGSEKDLNTSTNYLTIYGNDTFDRSGRSVCLSDIDNDGKDDIIIGAPESSGYNNNFSSPGECYIIYGDSKSKLNQTGITKMEWDLNVQAANVIFYGLNETETFGSTLTSGDIDNDTYPDLLIGVNNGDGPKGSGRSNSGKVYLWYGRPRSAENSTLVNTTFENVTVIYGA